jgi:hypothetical protein
VARKRQRKQSSVGTAFLINIINVSFIQYSTTQTLFSVTKTAPCLLAANIGVGLEINAEKTKCIIMYYHETAGQNHNIKPENKFFENVEKSNI